CHSRCLRICFFIIPLPPRSTLFPYTTLFRSSGGEVSQCMLPTKPSDSLTGKTGSKFDYGSEQTSVADDEVHEQVGKAHAAILLRSEEHTSELQSRENLVCRLLLEKKKKKDTT